MRVNSHQRLERACNLDVLSTQVPSQASLQLLGSWYLLHENPPGERERNGVVGLRQNRARTCDIAVPFAQVPNRVSLRLPEGCTYLLCKNPHDEEEWIREHQIMSTGQGPLISKFYLLKS